MSRNYDNWERLVAAVVKREQIRQLCHQDSVSTIYSDYSSSRLDSTLPLSLGSFIDTFESVQQLHKGESGTTILAELLQDLRVSDQRYLVRGTKVVVKSTSSSNITEDEIEKHMFVLAIFRHENVAIPWAYHFSEMTKFLVYDYYSKGSVFDMMHGKRNRPSWASRMRIAVGAARGIAYIHAQSGGEMVHGNIKSSNIFLNSKNYGCVSGFGFGSKKNEATQKSDVYSFGLLLVELITRELPSEADYVIDRLRSFEPHKWKLRSFHYKTLLIVDEVAMEGSCVFVDERIMRSYVGLIGLRRFLEVAKVCVAPLAEKRPTMSRVVVELEKITRDLSLE